MKHRELRDFSHEFLLSVQSAGPLQGRAVMKSRHQQQTRAGPPRLSKCDSGDSFQLGSTIAVVCVVAPETSVRECEICPLTFRNVWRLHWASGEVGGGRGELEPRLPVTQSDNRQRATQITQVWHRTKSACVVLHKLLCDLSLVLGGGHAQGCRRRMVTFTQNVWLYFWLCESFQHFVSVIFLLQASHVLIATERYRQQFLTERISVVVWEHSITGWYLILRHWCTPYQHCGVISWEWIEIFQHSNYGCNN